MKNVLKQTSSPVAIITSISFDGLVSINFNVTMKPPDHIQDIRNTTI